MGAKFRDVTALPHASSLSPISMKPTLLLLSLLLLAACETLSSNPPSSAPPNTPSLPFGDMRIVSQTHFDQGPTPAFMPSPFELRNELVRKQLSGDAVIAFTVPPKGGVPEKIVVKETTNPELAKLAAAYVARLRFSPARAGGAAVACDMEIPFSQH
jgi:outer membrane biosynthesis protein TonB